MPPAGTAPASLNSYEGALAAVADAFERELGLPRVDVQLVLFPGRRAFERGLLEIGYTPALARSASSFNAIGGARAVLVNASVVDAFDRARRVRLLAHELVHTMQYHFGGGTRGASEQWLREGFAEWVACRVTASLRLGSFDALRAELLENLSGARPGLPAAPFDKLSTFQQWVEAQERYEAPLYAQAFLAAELLVETRGVPAIVGYFQRFRTTTDRRRAFSESFGLDLAAFERTFAPRWQQTLSQYRASR